MKKSAIRETPVAGPRHFVSTVHPGCRCRAVPTATLARHKHACIYLRHWPLAAATSCLVPAGAGIGGLRSPRVNAFSGIPQCQRRSGRPALLLEVCILFNLCDRRRSVLRLEMSRSYSTPEFCASGKAFQTDHRGVASWNDIYTPPLASELLCFPPTGQASCGPYFCARGLILYPADCTAIALVPLRTQQGISPLSSLCYGLSRQDCGLKLCAYFVIIASICC